MYLILIAGSVRFRNSLLVLHVLLHVGLYGLIWWLVKSVAGLSWGQTAICLPFAYRLLNLL